MKLPILTATLLVLLTTPALAQDAPAPEMPSDMKPRVPARLATRTEKTALEPVISQERFLRFTMRGSSFQMCGKLVTQDRVNFHVRMNGGVIQRIAAQDLAQHKITTTCTSPGAETPKPTYEPPALQLPPPRMRYTKPRIKGDWALMALGGGLMSAAGGVAGGVLGYTVNQGCDGFLCELGSMIIGAGVGTILGGSTAVTVLGHSFGRNGNFVGATLGGLLGGGLSAAMSASLENPTATLFSIPLGTGVGATIGYLMTDDSSSVSVLPTQGGAYATYGFAF